MSYQPGRFFSRIDAAVVDGPSSATLRGREACLYQIFEKLRVGGLVFLDDYERKGEKIIVRNWLDTYLNCFEKQVIEVSDGICVFKKTHKGNRGFSARTLLDNWGQTVKLLCGI